MSPLPLSQFAVADIPTPCAPGTYYYSSPDASYIGTTASNSAALVATVFAPTGTDQPAV